MQIGISVRRFITFALVAMLMLGSLVAPTSTMAQSQTYQSSLTGVNIAYDAPYQIFEDGVFVEEGMEILMFVGPADVLAMGFMSPLIDLNGARDILLETLFGEMGTASTIDRGDYSGVSYSLDMLNMDGQEMGVFSLFLNQRSHGFAEFYIFLAPPTLFGSSMQTAQNSFTIDGTPLMDGVDALAMGGMVTDNIGITGGEAVTDVTDVTEPEDPETNTSETDTTGTGTGDSETTDQGDQVIYLLAVMQEYTVVDASLINIVNLLDQYSNEEITIEQAFNEITAEAEFLAGLNDRVALIEVPAGMEDLHQETLSWADAITAIGTSWIAAIDGTGTVDAASNALSHGIDVHLEFGDTIQAQQISSGDSEDTSDTGETTQTTETNETVDPTEVVDNDTDAVDADAYLQAIQNHRLSFYESFGAFNASLGGLDGEPTDAEIRDAFDGSLVEAEKWVGYSESAQQLTPPPGYENVQTAYQAWADTVTEMGNIWVAALNGDSAQLDVFFDYIPNLEQAETDLDLAIIEAEEQSSAGGDSTEATETGNGSESTTRTSRTSRSGGGEETDTETETDADASSGRPNRSDRSSGELSGETTEGNTSETSGSTSRTSRTSAGSEATEMPNEWVADVTGVTISWSDDLALNSQTDEPQVSDADGGSDEIWLETTSGQYATPVRVQVFENPGSDSTAFINAVVNDPTQAEDIWGVGTEVHDYNASAEASAALMHSEDEIGGYWIYVQLTCIDSSCEKLAFLEIATEGTPMVETLDIISSGLAVDGVNVSNVLPVSDVQNVVERLGD